ncbi:MAG: polysaccharide deacetylase family protein, partial [Butyricicoccus sp.]|nr:polysaccharide deacetylase family protein [Butyricicoccus sp.]
HAYNIGGYNYVRLRDFGRMLDYSVTYDEDAGTVGISSSGTYEGDRDLPEDNWPETVTAVPTGQQVLVNDAPSDIQGYEIGGYNYFKLRDLARTLDIQAIYDGAREAVELDKTAPYFEHQNNTIILMYHAFCETEEEALLSPTLYTTPERFRQNISDLLALGFEPLTLEQYYNGEADPSKKYFIVTIDDGYLNNYEIAYPLLKELNLHADIFCVVQDLSGGRDSHFTYPQAHEMEESGLVSIYSHNLIHERATSLPSAELSSMFSTAYHSLSQELKKKTIFLAYPYGDHNKETYLLAKRAGYKLQLVQGRQFAADDILVRMDMYYNTDIATLVQNAVYN